MKLAIWVIATVFSFGATAGEGSDLSRAVVLNQVDVVTKLLANGASPNVKDDYGNPVVFSALKNLKLLEVLIKHKVDLNVIDDTDFTPLAQAAFNSASSSEAEAKLQTIRLILGAGVPVDQEIKHRITPLMVAVTNSRGADKYKTVQLLLEHKANPNSRLCLGQVCTDILSTAVQKNNARVVTLLINAGADVNFVSPGGSRSAALVNAEDAKNQAIIEILRAAGAK